jgi:NADPH:quinone reductase-like Zn-dependent oxidoreductase
MKAIRIHSYGGRSVLSFEEAPIPEINPDDVLVRVVAASVNPVDWKIREGQLKDVVPHRLPLVLGYDFAGIIEAIGARVSHFKLGDKVYARPDIARDGAYAEYIAVRETEIALKPATISFAEAASLPLAGITAWEAIVTTGNVKPDENVLIHAASGGVGSLAVQIAKRRGAHVAATTSAKNRKLVETLGADLVIDYRSQNFADIVSRVDMVFDTVGGAVQDRSWATLRPGGILVSITDRPSPDKAGAHGVRSAFVFIQPNAEILRHLADMVDAGRLRPLIAAEFALKDVAKAHALSESGRAVGKIVLHVGPPS